jgi:hypothetical protein
LLRPDIDKWNYRVATAVKSFCNAKNIYLGCNGVLICRKNDFFAVGGYDERIRVREHRQLISQLRTFGKYKTIMAFATTSMRRYRAWGMVTVAWFWIQQWIKNYIGDLSTTTYAKVR